MENKNSSLFTRFRNLLGVGPILLLAGLLFEGLTILIQRWISISVPLSLKTQVILSVLLISGYLMGTAWFHRSLKLIKVNILEEERKLITDGPFNYVRHPLYSTLLLTIPPIFIIWFSDLLFLVPWGLILLLAHYVIIIEERELIKTFGNDYRKYQKYVPPLIPYKGAGGKLYREHRN